MSNTDVNLKRGASQHPTNMWDTVSRYELSAQVAMFLEAEWSDYLFGTPLAGDAFSDPMKDRARPCFYINSAKLLATHARMLKEPVARACDVGGATGRLVFELMRQFSDSSIKFVMVEPSHALCDWARRLLCEADEFLDVPTVRNWNNASSTRVQRHARMTERAKGDLRIIEAKLEDVPVGEGMFDIVSCCNVVDRHPSPSRLMNDLAALVRPGGLLMLASPLEFSFSQTSQETYEDLKALVAGDVWTLISETDEVYELRLFRRKLIRYLSQVLVLKRT